MKMNEDGTFMVERGDDGFPCPKCGGYASSVPCTHAERKEFGCGRGFDCCSVAFVCIKCKHRFAMSLPAPEME